MDKKNQLALIVASLDTMPKTAGLKSSQIIE